MESKFKIIMSSDIDYDELCAEIYYENQFVAIINQEKGLENLEIEIYPPQETKFWHFKYSEFEEILKQARKTLCKMRKLT